MSDHVLALVGLIVGVMGGAIGTFSIWVTWKLYLAGSDINSRTLELLAEIKASSHTAETTTTHFTEQLVGGLVSALNMNVQTSLETGRATAARMIEARLEKFVSALGPGDRDNVVRAVQSAVTDAFRSVEYQTAARASTLAEPGPIGDPESRGAPAPIAPGVPRLVSWFESNESRFAFLSVKFLRQQVFAKDPALQEALQFALTDGILEKYEKPNPKNPSWPTTACRLNRKHALVKQFINAEKKA